MNGILLLGKDEVIESRAKKAGVVVQRGDGPALSFEKTLITIPGARVPFDLLPAAFRILEHWDAAVPLWRYDVTAESAGTAAERELTRTAIRDLRVLLHAVELLFVRRNDAGCALIETWQSECAAGGDRRLAFLRAFYAVKPRLCVLPTSWLLDVRPLQPAHQTQRGRPLNGGKPLVTVELAPGRFVKCYAGDEQRVREHFERQIAGRRH
jgi:hypothetical protein